MVEVEPIQQRPVGVEDLGDGRVEQLLLAVEVVVERTHSDIGCLGDLQHRDVEPALGDQRLSRIDQRRPGCAVCGARGGWPVRGEEVQTSGSA